MRRLLLPLAVVTTILLAIGTWMIFFYAPIERTQGMAQKIFYFHVPSAWVAYLAIGVVLLGSVGYLWKRAVWMDTVAEASAEIGFVFCTVVLVSGPIWGKPIWGAWWVWDARLTSALILWLIYLAYVMLRVYAGGGERTAKACAVLGIVGALDVPVIHYSVRWWRTLHPKPVVMAKEGVGKNLAPEMLHTLLFCLLAFTLLYVTLMIYKISIIERRRTLEALQRATAL
ncbi:MAG: cytochrome C assembly protein [Deltaproteobacteria bacterium]|nr:MAG: cytochrome C assembly protein [Deltaproteobacteria bacterium]